VRPLVGLVPQEVSLYPELTAQENLRFFGRINGVGGEELEGRVDELLARVSLVARRRDRVATFSGGMKRRLNLACSLIHRPRLLLLDVASGLEEEKEAGTLTRLRMAPLHRWQLFGGKLLARFLVGLFQLLLLFAVGHVLYDISLGPSLPVFVLLCVVIVFSMTGFSLAVACFARTRERIIPLGLTVTMIVCAIGGCWWPLYQSPPWLQQAALAVPTFWAMEAIHDLILREKGLLDIAPAIAVLLAYGGVCLALGMRGYRLER
jgi:ABC-type multidrug transport system permease subunit